MIVVFRWLMILALLVPLGLSTVSAAESDDEDGLFWWNDRVFYEIFVRSFYDSTGDGIGDLQGIIEKMDYLQELGIGGIWLMPISPSPSYHGYDVIDYRDINPDYGTMEDFRALLEAAEAHDIAIIIDLVVNHSSVQHPWFIASADDPDGEFGDWYIWEEEDPGFRGPDNQVVWHQRGGRYYYGVFWGGMPDLNYRNPDVTAEMHDIARFWLEDVGVAGFRLDAIKHIIIEGRNQENTPATRAWLTDFRAFVNDVNPDALLVGEVWSSSIMAAPYTGTGVDIVFEFDLADAIIRAASFGVASTLVNQMNTILSLYPDQQYATFITNHDQNRVMSQLRGDFQAAKVAANILLTLPGVPFVYYGEEIGMTGTKPDPEIRTPMQWDGDLPNVGFTTGTPWSAINDDWADGVTVAVQDADPDSLLNHYREMIALRNATPALRRGSYVPVTSGAGTVFSFLRDADEQTVLVVLNLRDREIDNYGLTLAADSLPEGATLRLIYGEVDEAIAQPDLADGGFEDYKPVETLPPMAVLIFEIE
ncbi:MAG: DUF3459 domain-containing protein [Anaerolineaceae bacterium]|nr:MAG: DUF3459 domain-containing protein [Anaerolineaceae bacterium]